MYDLRREGTPGGPRRSNPCIMGIDPGLSGAVAFYWPAEPHMITVSDMPVVAGFVDCARLGDLVRQIAPSFAVIEYAGAMPAQGRSSGFNFGAAYGCIFQSQYGCFSRGRPSAC